MQPEETLSSTNDSEDGLGAVAARTRPYLLGLVAGWLVAEVASLTGITQSPALDAETGGLFTVFALSTVFFLHFASGRRWIEIGATAAIGLAVAVVAVTVLGKHFLAALSGSLAGASVVVLSVAALRAKGAERKAVLDILLPALAFPGFVFVSVSYLSLTAALRPAVWDGYAFRADAAFGFQASFVAGRLFKAFRPLAQFSQVVYTALPLALAAVHALATRSKVRTRSPDVVASLVVLGVAGYALYFVFPVVGPVYILGGYPNSVPSAAPAANLPLVAYPMPRNCMPSLHAAWALMAFWLTRARPRWARTLAAIFLAFTLLATLGLGVHYLVDLVAAVPFAAAIYAYLADVEPGSAKLRRVTMAGGAALLAGWLVLVRLAPDLLASTPPAMWILAAAVVGLPWTAVTMLQHRSAPVPRNRAALARVTPPDRGRGWLVLGGAFFLSGFAALCYAVVVVKSFSVVFGGTSRANATVLAVCMGGLALGSWLGGRLASRVARPLRAFALVEIGVALWCAGLPLAVVGVRAAYLALAAGTDPAATWLTPLQLALQTAALLPATLLMGCALPLLARHLATRAEGVGRAAGRFYGINIAGAAAGSVVGGYVLQPALGITQTLFVAVALEVLAATLAILLSRGTEGGPRTAQHPPMLEAGAAPERLRRLAWIALVVTCLDGVVTLALATIYVHLLAVVAGNSTYAYSLMVFAFLVGLAAGTVAGRRLLRTAIGFPELLVACQMGLALVVLVGTYLWNETPAHFANYEHYIIVRTFGSREAVRFAVCGLAMIPPAFFVGAAYPLVMAWVGAANPGREIAAVGRAGALNTAGNILGAILGGCVLIPLLGSLRSIQVIAVVALGLSALVLLAVEKHRSSWGLAVAMAAALFPLQPRSFDYTRLASGANIYFANQPYGRVIDHAESLDGGLTTIAESSDPGGRRVLTMLTNGKFQGDDSAGRKAEAQVFSSLVPLLHGEERGPALIVGLGTGVSARVASDAGFTPVHIAEHSRDVVDMVARYFGKANGNVLARPSTVSHVTDERNIFALDSRRYGFIGLEVSSIWFAGAARLYNREFYAIARAHLASRGVLEQRVQMHRLSHADLLSIVATARAEFSHVWLYFTPNQGVLVACDWNCRPSATSVRRLTAEPRLAADLDLVGGVAKLLDRRVLGPAEVDQFIAGAREYGLDPEQIVATDDNLLLEHSTPRANVLPYAESLADNLQFARRFAPQSPIAGTTLTAAQWDSLHAVAAQPEASP